jgi:hypothetical protein
MRVSVSVERSAELARLLEDDDIFPCDGAIPDEIRSARQRSDTAADEIIATQTPPSVASVYRSETSPGTVKLGYRLGLPSV